MIEMIPIAGELVYKYSSLFRLALMRAAPSFIEMTDSKVEKVIESIRRGEMIGWLVEDETLVAVAITKLIEDRCLETRDLLIYCAYALEKLSLAVWDEAFKQMSEYARICKCTSMTAYSKVDRIKQMAIRMGGNAEMVYLNIPLKGESHANL